MFKNWMQNIRKQDAESNDYNKSNESEPRERIEVECSGKYRFEVSKSIGDRSKYIVFINYDIIAKFSSHKLTISNMFRESIQDSEMTAYKRILEIANTDSAKKELENKMKDNIERNIIGRLGDMALEDVKKLVEGRDFDLDLTFEVDKKKYT